MQRARAPTPLSNVNDTIRPDLLFITQKLPYPPDHGDRIRTYHLLRYLSARARIHLACLTDSTPSAAVASVLTTLCSRVSMIPKRNIDAVRDLGAKLALGTTESADSHHVPQLAQVIEQWSKETTFAGCIATSFGLSEYLEIPGLKGVEKIVDATSIPSLEYEAKASSAGSLRGWILGRKRDKFCERESKVAKLVNAVTFSDARAAQIYATMTQATNVFVINNGVDLDYYRPRGHADETGCLFVGAIDDEQGVEAARWFARAIWPHVRHRHPDSRLKLLGRKSAKQYTDLIEMPGVDVIGDVTDIRPHITTGAVVIAPYQTLRNLPESILSVLASGKAVIASKEVLETFAEPRSLPMIVAHSTTEWIEHVGRLLDDAHERSELGDAGRRFVEHHHRWSTCLSPFCEFLKLSPVSLAGSRVDNPDCQQELHS
jgi:sugar transferase (PEP-CTERM/EpsH1 system associated)